MFTGIIEATVPVKEIKKGQDSIQITMAKPSFFDDLHIGDSIACNGVCLTVEKFDSSDMVFTIGFETLRITGWDADELKEFNFNVERSLRFGDRIHGHLVSGHVDTTTEVVAKEQAGDCLVYRLKLPESAAKEVWKKSSVTLNGVSLTVNDIDKGIFEVCLVPETLRKTNLESLQVGTLVNLETDYYMKGLLQSQGDARA